jgi:hypothetical protein
MEKWIEELKRLQEAETMLLAEIQKIQLRKLYVQGAIDALSEREQLEHAN